jgi:putative restriction endonuclease
VKAFIAVTDADWYRFLRSRPELEEVNFWQPGGNQVFRILSQGEPLLFKLHYPDNFIVGGGFFAHATILPTSFAWEAFGEKNGATTLEDMRRRIESYRRSPADPHEDYKIGCIILEAPFFLAREDWIPAPEDFAKNIVQGKTYNLDSGIGKVFWERLQQLLRVQRTENAFVGEGTAVYGDPKLVRCRLGQGAFRVLVTDVYQRRCAVTGEKALPVIEAAHIQPVSLGGTHRIDNGLLLRSDVHTLFDRGYVTVTSDHKFRVSNRLHKDFDNGEHYFALQGRTIGLPQRSEDQPSKLALQWHADTVFLG